jgi:tyrosyl-tRNA synthetase
MTEGTDPKLEAEVRRQLDCFRDGSVEFHGEKELASRLAVALKENRPLRVKLGMDPSAPDLHLGHTVVLDKLKVFQELGHTPIFLVGDFTARIGDPSGKKKTRPALEEAEIRANAETYVSQVAKVLDVEDAEVRFNSEWMDAFSPGDFVRLCAKSTVARLLERDDFATRYREETPIFVHEFLYPFVQGYDSVALHADVELGGTDQTFNLLMGRELQRAYGQSPQAVITHPLLVGTDGHDKMSKSLGNYIGVTDAGEEIYGKVMSLSDTCMLDYIRILGPGFCFPFSEDAAAVSEGQGDPLALKQSLASAVVARLQGVEAAGAAASHFKRVVQGRGAPESVPEQAFSLDGATQIGLIDVVTRPELGSNALASKGEFRRLVAQGAVQVDEKAVSDPLLQLHAGSYLIRLGKRKFARIVLS